MATPPLSDESALEAIEALRQAGGEKQAAADLLGIPRSTFVNRLQRAAERGLDGSVPKPIPPGQMIRGVSTLYDSKNNEILTWVKTRADDHKPAFFEAVQEFFEHYSGYSVLPPAPKSCDADLLTVYPIADLHLGMYAWAAETGADYDVETARRLLLNSMGQLVAMSPPAATGVVLNLGDFMHADSNRQMTPASGNILDVDTRYMKVLQTGVALLVSSIEYALQRHERVIVRNIPGNHDPHAALCLTIALDCFFHGEKRVEVDTNPSEFWFYRFGKVFLGAHHGHRAKPVQLAGAMAALHPKDWGASLHRHFFSGHIHHREALEVNGVEWEAFQTLAAKDAYAASMGYNSARGMKAIVFHQERGEVARNSVRLP